ncbi:MAG: hypothetical protein ACI86X_002014 [Moritella sp.]|jgi:hypothetical protein
MIDFTLQQEPLNWRISNDGVMGGESQGTLLFEPDHGVFTGNISLANQGGFSAAFRTVEPLNQDIAAVEVDIAGDGHKYQLRMMTNTNGQRLSYFHEFSTVAGQRQTLSFNFVDFKATFRGRTIPDAPTLKSECIGEVGFLLNTKQAGAFSLTVFAIDFIKR